MAENSFRDKLFNLLSSDCKEKEAILSLLTSDERRALSYKFFVVPSVAHVDPNRIPEPPFPDQQMKQLLKSAGHKMLDYVIEKIVDDEPSLLL